MWESWAHSFQGFLAEHCINLGTKRTWPFTGSLGKLMAKNLYLCLADSAQGLFQWFGSPEHGIGTFTCDTAVEAGVCVSLVTEEGNMNNKSPRDFLGFWAGLPVGLYPEFLSGIQVVGWQQIKIRPSIWVRLVMRSGWGAGDKFWLLSGNMQWELETHLTWKTGINILG